MRTTLPTLALFAFLAGCTEHKDTPESIPIDSHVPKPIHTKSGIDMVLIPAGEFTLGDDKGENDEQPAHRVRLAAFYMDVCEVTQASFQAIMGRNPSKAQGPDRPVERVSWLAAVQYCNMRSASEGLKPCYDLKTLACDFTADGYRLPTEAEWEYACRAGTTTRWSFGDDSSGLAEIRMVQGPTPEKTTHPVKEKQPNPWGLYDMHGNVAEWCNDFYAEHYDPATRRESPRPGQGRRPRAPRRQLDERRGRLPQFGPAQRTARVCRRLFWIGLVRLPLRAKCRSGKAVNAS